jgi:hypothetical protein
MGGIASLQGFLETSSYIFQEERAMKGNETREQPSTDAVVERCSEEMGDPVDEPDQRWQDLQLQCLLRNEKIRLVIIGAALLAMILSFLVFLRTGTVLPLFVTMVVAFLGYRRIDRRLDTSERSRS